ncbi:MAG: hypothetical protein HUU48_02070 [Flavobacteriales bacterium]|nr:hypothetical protein [Flavobacteriales bacterium]
MKLSTYLIGISTITAILLSINLFVFSYLNISFSFVFISIYLFLLGLNLVTYFVLAKAAAKKPTTFITVFMAVFGIKMFSALLFLVALILTHKDLLKPIAIVFLFGYISYFVLQVWASIKAIKNQDSSAA